MAEPSATSSRGADVTGPPGVSLGWTYELLPDRGLVVRAQIKNAGADAVYLLDRLWRLDRSSKRVLDPEAIYRFERGGSLRLLLGAAPLPSRKNVLYRNVPLVTLVEPGATWEREITLALPVKEHSCYFPEESPERAQLVRVDQVILIVQTLVVDADMKAQPSTVDPTAMEIQGVIAALTRAKLLISSAPAAGIEVLRRTDEFDRFDLPGEPPEPI
jgi:hypothetical protein